MIVYGRNAVREALRGRRSVSAVWADRNAAGADWLAGVEVSEVAPAELERLCGSVEHQGLCAQAGAYPYADPALMLGGAHAPGGSGSEGVGSDHPGTGFAAGDALVVALDEVQDPHNLGAVCRVAEAAGAAGVVIPERRAAEVTPAVCKSSAGAVEHLAVARVGNLANWLGDAKAAGAWVYGADAGPGAVDYGVPDYRGAVVLVLGSEGRGLRPRVAGACDQLVALPQHGRVGSLNVATAAAALVYGILHFRGQALDRGT